MILINGHHGIGDNFYQRPALKAMGPCHLMSPFPWIYHDMPHVTVVNPRTTLRTQKAYVESKGKEAYAPTPLLPQVKLRYGNSDFAKGLTPVQAFANCLGVVPEPAPFFLRKDAPRPAILDKLGGTPYGVVHPNTLRKEWLAPARNCAPGLLQQVIDHRPGLVWISVAWISGSEEWLAEDPLTGIAHEFNHGELSIEEIAALVEGASMILSSPGHLLPMAQSMGLGRKAFFVFGGHVRPSRLVDSRLGPSPLTVAPKPFCGCGNRLHGCPKEMSSERLLRKLR